MVENRWAEPDGFPEKPTPVVYRIRDDNGDVITRKTLQLRDTVTNTWYHSLHSADQKFADQLVHLVQLACEWFTTLTPAEFDGWPEANLGDAAIRTRIHRINRGENERERDRVNEYKDGAKVKSYPLDELPWQRQRALIERIEQHKANYSFEIIGEAETAPDASESIVVDESWWVE